MPNWEQSRSIASHIDRACPAKRRFEREVYEKFKVAGKDPRWGSLPRLILQEVRCSDQWVGTRPCNLHNGVTKVALIFRASFLPNPFSPIESHDVFSPGGSDFGSGKS